MSKLFTGKELTKDQQRMAGTILFTAIMLAASIATCCIPSNAVLKIAEASEKLAKLANVVNIAAKAANGVMAGANTVLGAVSGKTTYDASQANADSKEIERILKALEEMTEEEQQLLQQLLDQLQSSVGDIMALADKEVKTSQDILSRIGQSAAANV